MARPATLNQQDGAAARKLISEGYQLLQSAIAKYDKAWRLIQGIERREKEQHGSTGRTDRSQAARNRKAKRRK